MSESVEAGASPNERLLFAARSNNLEMMKEVLAAGQFDVNTTDGVGNTALNLAAESGSLEIVNLLLQLPGVNVNVANKTENATALHKVASSKRMGPDTASAIVSALISAGANPVTYDKSKRRPDQVALYDEIRKLLEGAVLAKELGKDEIEDDDDDDDDDD
ncbi:ankyrin repeat-containing domain protein, partial [Paraphysoderma sedebokerense]